MATAPTGTISLAQNYLRLTLADVTAFRTWVGASTQDQALARIHHDALPAPRDDVQYEAGELEQLRPFAIVYTADNGGFRRRTDSQGSGNLFSDSGVLKMVLEWDVPEAIRHNDAEVMMRFRNDLGLIVDGLCELAGKAGYLDFHTVALEEGPARTLPAHQESEGDFCLAFLSFEWDENRRGG